MSVSPDSDDNYRDLDDVGTFETDGNLLPPRSGWPCGDLRIIYTGGYETPTATEDGNVPVDLQRAVEITANYTATADAAPNVPRETYETIQFDHLKTPQALPSAAMRLLQPYQRKVIA